MRDVVGNPQARANNKNCVIQRRTRRLGDEESLRLKIPKYMLPALKQHTDYPLDSTKSP